MGLLIIDETKCKKDSICARECPLAIIKLKDGDGFPEIRPGGEAICNSCGTSSATPVRATVRARLTAIWRR